MELASGTSAEDGPFFTRRKVTTLWRVSKSTTNRAWVELTRYGLVRQATVWLQTENDRHILSTCVSLASFGTRCAGMRLHTCRRTSSPMGGGGVFKPCQVAG